MDMSLTLTVLGREVKLLYEGLVSGAAEHQIDAEVRDLPGGQYFYRVEGAGLEVSRPVVRVR